MIHYLLQSVAFQLLFLVVYDLFLRKETFFNGNRIYLLITPILSLLLPFIQIAAIRENIPPEFIIQLPAVIINGTNASSVGGASTVTSLFGFLSLWQFIWMLGAVCSVVFFGIKLYRIHSLKRKGSISKFGRIQIVLLPGTTTAFSFFRSIYLGADLSEAQQKNILIHEQVHISEKHSYDLLFFELLRILFWFNPLIYVFQNRMLSLHEFLADRKVASQKSHKTYYQELLSQVFQTEKISFINTFFNRSLIKNRIVMLQKSKSKKIVQLKYLLLVPVVCGMLIYTSCAQETDPANTENTFEESNSAQSEIIRNIEILKESIAKQGNMTKEEEDALKVLVVLTSDDGVDNMYFDEVKDKVGIPFGVIEQIPTFAQCENLSKEANMKCVSKTISTHVGNNFNTKLANDVNLVGKQRIKVKFIIDTNGSITKVVAKGPHPALEAEAVRVVSSIPTMIPGKQQGKKVSVEYALPIIFQIDE